MFNIVELGFGRSGTLSLKAALEELGFGPCYHFSEMFDHPEHVAQWRAASRGEAVDWERLSAGYGATVYLPPGFDGAPLLARFPQMKALLTTREPERWYESVRGTIYHYNRLTFYRRAFLRTAGLFKPEFNTLCDVWDLQQETLWDRTFHGRFHDKAHAIEVYRGRIEEVRRTIPPERLLVYSVKEGWEPLCRFLGVEVPDRPFPHLNDTESFLEWRTGWKRKWFSRPR